MGGDGSLAFVARVPGDPQIDVTMNLNTNASNLVIGTLFAMWRSSSPFGTMNIAGTIVNPGLAKSSLEPGLSLQPIGLAERLRAAIGR
jgi:hypothetical protein